MGNGTGDIEDLLERAYESEDAGEVEELVERALELDPENPEVLLLQADLTEDDDVRLPILVHAIENARSVLREEGIPEEDFAEDELGTVYLALLQRAAFTLFSMEDDERSFEIVQELMRHDLDDQGSVRSLYYRILIEKRDWSLILRETMQDGDRQLGWAYARLAACFMLTEEGEGGTGEAAAMFWDALSMAPNVPFYMLGYFPDPVDDSEEEEEDFHFSLLFSDVWSSSHDLLNWFSRGVILFGLLSGRFGEEADDMLEILRSLGGGEEYDKMEALLDDQDDGSLIETLAAHRCLSER
ncbi:hypothetical protein [uncultured Fretibacterium sp.]|uniref:hypothetical protein n=1 Tax=uncultured Fretibacterium sp. TaxID=1678694 RepID=UPI0028DBCC7D|nr:hypothetical protein [uncultured Fretibacterium sp.]